MIQRTPSSKKSFCCVHTCHQFSNLRQDRNWHIRISCNKRCLSPHARNGEKRLQFSLQKHGQKVTAWTVETCSPMPTTCSKEIKNHGCVRGTYFFINRKIQWSSLVPFLLGRCFKRFFLHVYRTKLFFHFWSFPCVLRSLHKTEMSCVQMQYIEVTQ